jgi:hypothetical protein
MNPITAFPVSISALAGLVFGQRGNSYLSLAIFRVAIVIAVSLKIAKVCQKFVILRMEKL